MGLEAYIRAMPKVELHVHLEGATRPRTLLHLAARHNRALPGGRATLEALSEWYQFRDFDHFLDVYTETSQFIRTPEDIEFITRAFLQEQGRQNIRYSEVTWTAYTHYQQKGLPFDEQLDAINRAREWGVRELGVRMNLVIDIARMVTPEEGLISAEMAISGIGRGVVAFGLGGPEAGHPPEKFTEAFAATRAAGLPSVPHAGEMAGPDSIRGALDALKADRIGHGVRCLEDPALVAELRQRQVPLEVCPTSNVCLGVFPSLEQHALPQMLAEGLYITLGSDDPPMFNTTLTDEYLQVARIFSLGVDEIDVLVLNGLRAAFLPPEQKTILENGFRTQFAALRARHLGESG